MKAPWSPEVVKSLNESQQRHDRHPYTCPGGPPGNCRKTPTGGVLVATENGWICETCDYKQNWAH